MLRHLLNTFDFGFFDIRVIRTQGPDLGPVIPQEIKYQSVPHRPPVRLKAPDHRSGMKGFRRLRQEGRI